MAPWKINDPDPPETGNSAWIIGITGGVGAGKSRILKILEEEFQAHILLADEVAAELEKPGQEGLRLLTERFGKGILLADGSLDRKAFAEWIFQDPSVLLQVNAIIHPLTWQKLCEKVAAIIQSASGNERVLIAVEAALFDEKSRQLCDTLWYVDTTEEKRIVRLMENRGYSWEKCQNIIHNQPGREDFLALADEVIDNNGTLQEAREQIARLLQFQGFFI